MTDALKPGRLSRRAVLAAPLLAAALAQAARGEAPPEGLAEDVETYVNFGVHRAGTRGDARTAAWLRRRLARLGYAARLEKFPIRTLIGAGGRLELGGSKVRVFPQWMPPGAALGEAITAPLLPLDAPGEAPAIRFAAKASANSPYWAEPQAALLGEAEAKNALALVLAISNPSGSLYASNRDINATAHTLPVALVAERDLPRLAAAAGTATLRLKGALEDRQAINVIGYKSGTGRTIVLSTPLTGWFSCGGERGPGIALWLRMAAELVGQTRPVLLLGTGAHEIGQLGMAEALASVAPAPEDTAFWMHFGASTAATQLDAVYGVTSPQYLVATNETAESVRDALLDHAPVFVIGNPKTAGEMGQVIGAGHRRFAALSGHFPAFHTPEDKGEAIDFVKLDEIGKAASGLIARFAAEPDAA